MCVTSKAVLKFSIDVAVFFYMHLNMETKKSNPTRVWHARNLVSVAAKMTSSSIDPCRLCRSASDAVSVSGKPIFSHDTFL